MRAAFSSIVVLMVASAILQLSLVVDFKWSAPKKEIKIKSLMTGVLRETRKAPMWDAEPDLKRASFLSSCPDGDESSLSSVDDSGFLRPKLKGE
jgi:hypothetical protein